MQETLKEFFQKMYGKYTEREIKNIDIAELLERIKNNQVTYQDIFVISVSIGIMQDIYNENVLPSNAINIVV